jgi:PAS domain S-box-containing protein
LNYQAKTKYELIDELLKLQRENESLKISYSKDISECIKLLEEQRVREKYYSTLFDAVDEGFCIVEVIFDENEKPIDYRFLVINPSFEKQAGLTNATGKRMRELAPEHEKYWFEIYGKIAKTGQPERFENYAEQLHRWYDVYAFRIGQPETRQVAILFNDITRRKQIEEALRLEKENFRHSLDDSLLGVCIATMEGNTIYANKTLLNFYGYDSLGELQKTPLKNRYSPESYAQAHKRKRQREPGDFSATDYKISIFRKNGEIRHLQVFRKHVLWDGVSQFQIVYFDITDRKLVEEEIRKSKNSLETLNKHLIDIRENEMSQIAMNLHDDIGQKLTALNLDIAWLKSRIGVQSKNVREKFEEMTGTIKETIESIRETSSLLRPAILFDLGLVPAIKSQLVRFEKQTGIVCHFYYEPEEFNFEDRISLTLYRILQESLTNIARHSGASTTEVELRVLNNKIEIIIKDNGKGIEKDKVNSLGSMGIAGMKERLKAAHGKIIIRGEPGSGTQIKVIIPLIKEKSDD